MSTTPPPVDGVEVAGHDRVVWVMLAVCAVSTPLLPRALTVKSYGVPPQVSPGKLYMSVVIQPELAEVVRLSTQYSVPTGLLFADQMVVSWVGESWFACRLVGMAAFVVVVICRVVEELPAVSVTTTAKVYRVFGVRPTKVVVGTEVGPTLVPAVIFRKV
jgi:hypothetical protein